MTAIVVIGSGFGGLASALRLQARGYSVTLLEKRQKPGQKDKNQDQGQNPNVKKSDEDMNRN